VNSLLRIAVAILTKDEAVNLPRCLDAIPRDIPIFIVDSGSTDGTLAIAEARGCQILARSWTGFADQRNFTLQSLQGQFDWVIFIDADEVFPEPIWTWVSANLGDRCKADVVYMSQRIHIGGRMLRHAPHYPIYHPRIVKCRPGLFLNNRSGHGETVIEALNVQYVDIPYHHHIIAHELVPWLRKHVSLAQMEANAAAALASGVITRRAKLNAIVKIGPLRAPLRFLFHYGVCGGWRDGRPGLIYSALYGWYELTKWLASIRV
jgi:glycosyltransferase involved in cell wall biosynthesis